MQIDGDQDRGVCLQKVKGLLQRAEFQQSWLRNQLARTGTT